MSIANPLFRPVHAYRQLRDAGREHTKAVNETYFQHARAASRFSIKFTGFAIRAVWRHVTSDTKLGRSILALGVEMASRNPTALKNALADVENFGPIKSRNRFQIPKIFFQAAWRTAFHAIVPGAYPDGGSRRIIRVARHMIGDAVFDKRVEQKRSQLS